MLTYRFVHKATALDRATGGFTLILHHRGSVNHQLTAVPENIRIDTYFPPRMVSRFPELKQPIADISQMFIEQIAPTTVRNWIAGMKEERPALNDTWRDSETRSPGGQRRFWPFPSPVAKGTARYVFRGRPPSSMFAEAGRDQSGGELQVYFFSCTHVVCPHRYLCSAHSPCLQRRGLMPTSKNTSINCKLRFKTIDLR